MNINCTNITSAAGFHFASFFSGDEFNEIEILFNQNIINKWIVKFLLNVINKNISKSFARKIQNVHERVKTLL